MRTGVNEGGALELATGCVAVVAVAFTAAFLFDPSQQLARGVVMALGAGVLAAVLRDWRASAGVTVLAALVFVGFLAHRAGQLTGDAAPWRYTAIIGVAALLGWGQRWIRTHSLAPLVRPLGRPATRTRTASARY